MDKRAETFNEIGNEQAVTDEIWALTETLRSALFSALFNRDEDQDLGSLIDTTVAEATASLQEHAERWKNMEPMSKSEIAKGAPSSILKIDSEEQLVFGFFNVSVNKSGDLMVDLQDDIITPTVLEGAAYEYVLESRAGGDMHEGDAVATLVESMVFTPEKLEKMGLDAGTIPTRWWGGFKIHDPEIFEMVKSGDRPMFSIEGEAERVEVPS